MSEQDSSPPGGLVQMVTPIESINEQIGKHMVGALQKPGTVALLSTVIPGVGQDQVVSIPLTPQQFHAIQGLLTEMIPPADVPAALRKVIGFGREE